MSFNSALHGLTDLIMSVFPVVFTLNIILMPFSLLRYLSIYYLALCLIKNHHMHTQFTLPAPTVSVLKVHHWRQGYLCCFWLSLADAFYRCFSLKHCEGAGMHIQKTAVCTHCRTQTHYRMEFYLPINTRVPCPPRESSNKHTHIHVHEPTHRPPLGDEQHLLIRPSVPAPGAAAGFLLAALSQCHLACLPVNHY